MNPRERFRRILNFQPVDRLPLMEIEGYEEPTLARWHAEGLPEDQSPAQVLGLEGPRWLPVNFYPVPSFERRVLAETDDYVTSINWMGITVKHPKGRTEYTYEGYVDFPVKDRNDWPAYRDRLDGHDSRRYSDDWGPELWGSLSQLDRPVGLLIHPYFFRLGLYSMGLENFLLAFYEQPDLLHEMFAHCTEMTLAIIDEVVTQVKVDYACIAEDMAYRTGPHISPQMYREFWFPHQPPVIEALKKAGIGIIAMWSSGDLRPILPVVIEAGFNTIWPVEDFVGMNIVELRREYGRDLRFIGNIGIRAVAQGQDAIDREIETKVLPMIEEGGYIPTLDDQAPPDISWENYSYYINRLKEL